MWLKLFNIHACVTRSTPEESEFLWNYLSFEDAGSAYARRAGLINNGWDGKIRMYDRQKCRFPAGLLPLLKKGAARANVKIDVEDARTRIEPTPGIDTSWLDPKREQPQALAACLLATRGVVWGPTGSGKTEIICALAKTIATTPSLVLVTSKDLLKQTADRWEARTGRPAGVIGDGRWDPKRFTVATVQTLMHKLKAGADLPILRETGLLIADECHQAPGNSFQKVAMATTNAYWRFGFSGTPLARGDQRNVLLIAAFGEVIYRIKAGDLIARGVLSQPKIKFLPCFQAVPGVDWQSVYRAGVVDSEKRNTLLVGLALTARRPCVLFVREIDHGRVLRRMLERRGVNTDFVWGDDGVAARKNAIKRLVNGDTEVLIASTIFDTGVDIPELAAIVVGAGLKSAIKTIQRLGRGMRVTATKNEIDLYDIDDRGNVWLADHAKARSKTYRAEGFEVSLLSETESALAIQRGSDSRERTTELEAQ